MTTDGSDIQEFAGGVAHELNNHLQVVFTFLSLASDGECSAVDQARHLAVVRDAARALRSMGSSLLRLSEPLEPAEVLDLRVECEKVVSQHGGAERIVVEGSAQGRAG